MPLVFSQWYPVIHLNLPTVLAPFFLQKFVIFVSERLLVILSRSWSPLHQAIRYSVLIGPSVRCAARDSNGFFYPRAGAFILITEIVPTSLRSELFAKPVEQRPHVPLPNAFQLFPGGLDRRLEFSLIQFLKFRVGRNGRRAMGSTVSVLEERML